MVTSDLVYSPAQVTEHRHVELKDHDISEDTRRKFEELKVQFPKVFSLNNEDISHTQLVTMDIDTGDSPLDFILAGQQSQMDGYREMTHSNQA